MTKKSVAIIGSGVAGMGCAHLLQDEYNISIFDKNSKTGGHTNTLAVSSDEHGQILIDTGFMVFNKATYPCLTRLFDTLNVAIQATDMSFSVTHRPEHIEWNGAGLNKLFGQRKNIISPRFWKLMLELDRFNKEATQAAQNGNFDDLTVKDFLREQKYGRDFLNLYLAPMSGAIWSSQPGQILDFPISTLMRFFYNHGFLGLATHHQWYTVTGGSQEYAKKLIQPFKDRIQTNRMVQAVTRKGDKGILYFEEGQQLEFDIVILACHADEARVLLKQPTEAEAKLLAPFHYQYNYTQLHSDVSVMPQTKRCWASWNYEIKNDPHSKEVTSSTHYWMNHLQNLPGKTPYFVSLNAQNHIDPKLVHDTIHYHHPIFTLGVIAAQKELPHLNQQSPQQSVYFCGSYFRYGFHEDALHSAVKLCETLTQQKILL